MERLSGTVTTQPKSDGGRITFVMTVNGKPVSCVSDADFEGGVPNTGVPLTLIGEQKADLIHGRTDDFVFAAIEY